jgi:mRNA-degrading endonuclease YafQ of YafQ-DinJ toxin-antitoxin module
MPEYAHLVVSSEFIESFGAKGFSYAERQRFIRALRMLDTNEQHPSLRIHSLQGKEAGTWSASASDELRITFKRLPDGGKLLLACSRHYQ